MNHGGQRKTPPPSRRAGLSFIVYHAELWNTSQPSAWQKQSHAPMSKEPPLIQASPPLSRHPISSPLTLPLLATLRARPKQFSKKLFAFARIHFQLFLRFPFVGAFDCLSGFPHPLRGFKALGLNHPLKNASHRWDLGLSEFERRGPADSEGCRISAPLVLNDHFRSCPRYDLTFKEKMKQ